MKIKDYQWLIWVIVLAIAVLASSCSGKQAKVQPVGKSHVDIIDVNDHIEVGDTIMGNRLRCLVVVKAVYNN